MIQTRSADSRCAESADSSDRTASAGRAAASSPSRNSFDCASPPLPSSLASVPSALRRTPSSNSPAWPASRAASRASDSAAAVLIYGGARRAAARAGRGRPGPGRRHRRARAQQQVRAQRRLVRVVDAGEVRDLAGARLGVEALRVARLARPRAGCRRTPRRTAGRRRRGSRAARVAVGAVRADQRDERDHAGVGDQPGDLADPPDVLVAVLGAEARGRR